MSGVVDVRGLFTLYPVIVRIRRLEKQEPDVVVQYTFQIVIIAQQ